MNMDEVLPSTGPFAIKVNYFGRLLGPEDGRYFF